MKKAQLALFIMLAMAVSGLAAQATEGSATVDGKKLRFQVFATGDPDDFVVDRILVIDATTGSVRQTITGFEANPTDDYENLEAALYIEDINFDGYPDLGMPEFLPAGPNIPFLFWVYDPKVKRFEPFSLLEGITSPIFDSARKLIISYWRDGPAHNGKSSYSYISGKPVEILREEIVRVEADGSFLFTRKKLSGGKLVEVFRETRSSLDLE